MSVLLVVQGCGRGETLGPDIALNFSCDEKSNVPSAATIGDFLKSHGFNFQDAERVRRQYGKGFYPMDIEGFDEQRRMITFIGLSYEQNSSANLRSVILNSPPPTRHDRKLEKDIQDFITQNLQCKITSEQHEDNGPERKEFYDELFALLQSRMHEGAVCDKSAKTFDLAACRDVPGTH
jgi:hypothetical protein